MTGQEVTARSLNIAIVDAIAARKGIDSMDLDFSLHEYIDTDAVDALMDGRDTDWHLRFAVADHTVAVDSDGIITVDGTEYRWIRS